MREFHRRNDAVDDHGGTQPRSEAEEQHSAALVAADRLHRGVVQQYSGPVEGLAKIEPNPTGAEIVRLGHHFAVQDDAWVSDGDGLVGPVPGKRMYFRDHLTGGEIGARFKLPQLAAPENARLHMASADVDGEYSPVVLWSHMAQQYLNFTRNQRYRARNQRYMPNTAVRLSAMLAKMVVVAT